MPATMDTVTQVSDALIALSYGVIPIQIVYFFYRAKSQRDHLVVRELPLDFMTHRPGPSK